MTKVKVDVLLDIQHADGINLYLIKSRRSNEIAWIQEANLPNGLEDQITSVRRLKGEFAKSRVFGSVRSVSCNRAIRLNEANAMDPSADVSSSDSESNSSSSDDGALKSAGRNSTVVDGDKSIGILAPASLPPDSSILWSVGCRSIQGSSESWVADEDAKLNDLFVNLMYGRRAYVPWFIRVIDLIWCLVLTGPACEERSAVLEQLCLLISRLQENDTVVSKSIEELLSEASVDEIDSKKFDIICRLVDLVSPVTTDGTRSDRGINRSLDHDMTVPVDKAGREISDITERFSYVEVGETELDDDGIIELVYKIYKSKNPEKLSDVPGIIEKYRNQLTVLFSTLMKKYEVNYADMYDKRMFLPMEVKARILKEHLENLFTVFEPSRLPDVEEIVNNFVGKPTKEVADYIEHLERSYQRAFGGSSSSGGSISIGNDIFGLRQLIKEALSVGNPEKVPHLDQILSKYSGREHFVYLSVCDKYGVPIEEERLKAAMELREQSVEKDRKARMRKVLTQVYEKYNKDKVSDIDKLLEKFNVLELFDLVAKKYGMSLAEKVKLLISTGVHMDADIDFSPLLVDTVNALACALEIDRRNQYITRGLSSRFLQGLFNPLVFPVTSAELTLQAKSSLYTAHGPAGSIAGGAQVESMLRDLVEATVTDSMRSLAPSSIRAQVTAQEPEYNIPDAFGAVETGRCSCVVSLKADDGHQIETIISAVNDRLASQEVRQVTGAGAEPVTDDSGIVVGPGSVRCLSILHSGNITAFVGDYRALQINGKCPSQYRNRLAVWDMSSSPDVRETLVTSIMRRGSAIGKTSIIINESNLVSVVGSQKHRIAFKKSVELVKRTFGDRDPDFCLFIPKRLCMGGKPGMVLPPQIHEWSDVTYHESGDDVCSESQLLDEEQASETLRPLKLTRQTMRDSYLQGLLCLNCDETTHKPPECPIKRKVCWNCHGAHAGASCVLPCRFCKGRHSWGILECVKRGAKRYADWVKSRSCAEEKGLGSMVDDVIARLRVNGWNMTDPAISATCKSLTQMGVFVDLYVEMAKYEDEEEGRRDIGQTGLGASTIKPVAPREPAPPLPDSKYSWVERVWLDEIMSPVLIGRDPLRLITAQKGNALKKLEVDENVKILFKGSSAKEIFGSAATDPAIDVRFHAVIMADSPGQALAVKKALHEMLSEIEAGVTEGSIAKPPVVEGFSFLEKVSSLNDNIAQFDFMNVNGGAPIEIELKNHFELIGDLRHWLHQKGVEVELGDDDCVKLPSSGKVIQTLDGLNKINVDSQYIDIFNAFFELVSFWSNVPPSSGGQYWFEPYELRPAGLLGLADMGADHSVFESGQVVFLSEYGVDHFAKLLVQAAFVQTTIEEVANVLSSLKGVVRTSARDNRLLMYLRHPWSLSSSAGTVSRDVPEDFDAVGPFASVLNANQLRQCGRMGHSDTDSCDTLKPDPEIIRSMLAPYNDESLGHSDLSELVPGDGLLKRLSIEAAVPEGELPYVGYIVDWVTPQEVTDFVSGFSSLAMDETVIPDIEPMEAPVVFADVVQPVAVANVEDQEDLDALTVNELREKLKAKDLPATGRKADLIERIKADLAATSAGQSLKCRVELPRALMTWAELANNLSGPGNSHFAHIKQTCPTVNIACVGTAAAALIGEARLHVQLTATDPEDFNKARLLVEDLVKAVVEVGSDICLADEPKAVKDAAMKEVRVIDAK